MSLCLAIAIDVDAPGCFALGFDLLQVLALKRAWEIDEHELTLEARVEGGSEGAYGDVWRGRLGDVVVAVKMLRAIMMELDETAAEEFEREIDFMQRTRHANLVRFFGFGRTADGIPFLVEELMHCSLKAVVRGSKMRPLSWSERTRIAADVANGMDYIHSQRHIHRDLKSGNVLVSSSLVAKVADFGSIRHLLAARQPSGTAFDRNLSLVSLDAASMTHLVGTPLYMSPEVLAGRAYDHSTDLFAFGVLLWELAAQAPPDLTAQEELSSSGSILAILCAALQEGKRLAPGVGWPSNYVEIMQQCWQTDPSARPSFSAVKRRLAETAKQAATL